MFQKWSRVTVARENYSDTVEFPVNEVTRKFSIASYNFSQKTMFFSHVNKVVEEPFDKKLYKLLRLTAVSTTGNVYTVVCDEATEIAIARGNYATFAKISELRSSSSILIDDQGFLCKIVDIEDYEEIEEALYDVRSNKGNSKFVNGLMFKA